MDSGGLQLTTLTGIIKIKIYGLELNLLSTPLLLWTEQDCGKEDGTGENRSHGKTIKARMDIRD